MVRAGTQLLAPLTAQSQSTKNYRWLLNSSCCFSSAGAMHPPHSLMPLECLLPRTDIEVTFSLLVVYGLFISCCNGEGFINDNQPLNPAFWLPTPSELREHPASLLIRDFEETLSNWSDDFSILSQMLQNLHVPPGPSRPRTASEKNIVPPFSHYPTPLLPLHQPRDKSVFSFITLIPLILCSVSPSLCLTTCPHRSREKPQVPLFGFRN